MRLLAGVAVACALVLTACNEDDGSDAKTSSPTPSTASASPTAPASATPSQSASSPQTSTSPSKASSPSASVPASSAPPPPAPGSKEGAIERYEYFLHAVGREDLDAVCEVAAPAAKKAENDGFGPCRSTFPITFRLIPDSQQTAMRTATVDPKLVAMPSPTKVVIPITAVKSTPALSQEGLGDSAVMEYVNNKWYVTD